MCLVKAKKPITQRTPWFTKQFGSWIRFLNKCCHYWFCLFASKQHTRCTNHITASMQGHLSHALECEL